MIAAYLRVAFPDFHLKLFENTYQEAGQRLSIEVQASGTHSGPFNLPPDTGATQPLSASGKKLETVMPREIIIFHVDTNARIKRMWVRTVDGSTPCGPLRAYMSFGGQLQESISTRNIRLVHEMYSSFQRGDIAGILSITSENADWRWGDDEINGDKNNSGHRKLPWYGRWIGHAGIRKGFAAYGSSIKTLQFEPKHWYSSVDGNSVMVLIECIMRKLDKPTSVPLCVMLAHRMDFDQQGKLIKCREYSDSLTTSRLFE